MVKSTKVKGSGSEPELEPDAWARFERAIDVVAKSPPQPKKKAAAVKRKSRKKKP